MSAASDPVIIQTCTSCGALIDISDEEPFAAIHCPACGTAQRVRRNFDHFELQEELGAGGMGKVYRALDTKLNRPVALKVLRKEYSADQVFVAQFEKEASITASINHPNVVKVYTVGQDRGLVYIVMELVDKGSLDDLMTLQGRVAEAQVLEIGIGIAKGLNAALQRGLIHRDIKPGNILFADAHTAKIVDFGLAVLQEHASTVAGEVWGTPYYVAPEKLDNQPEDFRSDMYSLGGTLFHALAGRPPFEAETASMVALKHIKSQAVSLQAFAPDVSSSTAYVINKTLSKEPGDRYQSYDELVEHLDYARSQMVAKLTRGPSQKSRVVLEDARTARAMSWMTFGMIGAIVAVGVYVYLKREDFFPSDKRAEPTPDPVAEAIARIEEGLKKARELIEGGEFEKAESMLAELEAKQGVPQPLLTWITLHRGLAMLFAGREAEAAPVFAEIETRGVYSHDPAEAKVSNFFIDVARNLADQAPVMTRVARDLNKTNYEAIAFLLYGLKNWHKDKFEDGRFLLQQFKSSRPEAPYEWISSYVPLATEYINAYVDFDEVSKKLRTANSVEEMKEAVAAAREVREKIKIKGEMVKILDALIEEVEKKIKTHEKEQGEDLAAQAKIDAKAIEDLRKQGKALFQELRFPEALALSKVVIVHGEEAKRAQAAFGKKAEWLTRYKTTLIADINAGGYTQRIVLKRGQAVPGTATRANENNLEVRTPYSNTPVAWTDLSLDTIYQMGRSFIRAGMPPEVIADRAWLCGVFAFVAGKPVEGRKLLDAAANTKAEYKEDLPLFDGGGIP